MEKSPFPTEDMALTTILVVSEMSRAKDFYQDVLGAEIYREYGGDSCVIRFLGNWILLVTAGGPTDDKPDTQFVPPLNPENVSHSFTIRVKDCMGCYETLKERGADFLTPPVDWGAEIRAFFRDPDGHLFEISQA
ncbi:VOC family protein [Ekhidna sp.]|uniref:VOC family protein n=1 Tax=Ekhidna sp. TaxID=2608089 RepID=UPI0032984896